MKLSFDAMLKAAEIAFEKSYSENVSFESLENEFIALRAALEAALAAAGTEPQPIIKRCGDPECACADPSRFVVVDPTCEHDERERHPLCDDAGVILAWCPGPASGTEPEDALADEIEKDAAFEELRRRALRMAAECDDAGCAASNVIRTLITVYDVRAAALRAVSQPTREQIEALKFGPCGNGTVTMAEMADWNGYNRAINDVLALFGKSEDAGCEHPTIDGKNCGFCPPRTEPTREQIEALPFELVATDRTDGLRRFVLRDDVLALFGAEAKPDALGRYHRVGPDGLCEDCG